MIALPIRSAICSGSDSVCAAGLGDHAYTVSGRADGVARAARRSALAPGRFPPGVRSALNDRDLLALGYFVAFLDEQLLEGALDGRDHRNLHLHRLHDEDRFLFLQRLTRLGDDLPDLAG